MQVLSIALFLGIVAAASAHASCAAVSIFSLSCDSSFLALQVVY